MKGNRLQQPTPAAGVLTKPTNTTLSASSGSSNSLVAPPSQELDRLLAFYQDDPDFNPYEEHSTGAVVPVTADQTDNSKLRNQTTTIASDSSVQHTRRRGKQPFVEAASTNNPPVSVLAHHGDNDDDYLFAPAATDEMIPFNDYKQRSNQSPLPDRSVSRSTATSDLYPPPATSTSSHTNTHHSMYLQADQQNSHQLSPPPHQATYQPLSPSLNASQSASFYSAPSTPTGIHPLQPSAAQINQLFISPSAATSGQLAPAMSLLSAMSPPYQPFMMAPYPPIAATHPTIGHPQPPPQYFAASHANGYPLAGYSGGASSTFSHNTSFEGDYTYAGSGGIGANSLSVAASAANSSDLQAFAATGSMPYAGVMLPPSYTMRPPKTKQQQQQHRSNSISSSASSSQGSSANSAIAVVDGNSSFRSASASSANSMKVNYGARGSSFGGSTSAAASAAVARLDFEQTDRVVAEIYQYQEDQQGALLYYNQQRERFLELQQNERDGSSQKIEKVKQNGKQAVFGHDDNNIDDDQFYTLGQPQAFVCSPPNNCGRGEMLRGDAHDSFTSVEGHWNESATSATKSGDEKEVAVGSVAAPTFSFIGNRVLLPSEITTDPSAKKKQNTVENSPQYNNGVRTTNNNDEEAAAATLKNKVHTVSEEIVVAALSNGNLGTLSNIASSIAKTPTTNNQLPPAYIDWPAMPTVADVINGRQQPSQVPTHYSGTLGTKKKGAKNEHPKGMTIVPGLEAHRRVSRFMPPPPPSLQAARVMSVCHPTKGGGAEYYEDGKEAAVASLVASQAKLHSPDGKTCIAEGDFAFLTKAPNTSDWGRGGYGATYSATTAEGAPASTFQRLDPSGDGFQNYLQVLMQWYARVARIFGHNDSTNEFHTDNTDGAGAHTTVIDNHRGKTSLSLTRPQLYPTTRQPPRYFAHKVVPPCPKPESNFLITPQEGSGILNVSDLDQFVAWHDSIQCWWERYVQPRTVGHALHVQLFKANNETYVLAPTPKGIR